MTINTLTDAVHAGSINIGDTLADRSSNFTWDQVVVTGNASNIMTVSPNFSYALGKGYYRIGDVSNSVGEWNLISGFIQAYSVGAPSGYRVPIVAIPLTISGHHIKVGPGLNIQGGNTTDIFLTSADSVSITGDTVMYALDGVEYFNAEADSVTNTYMSHFGNGAILKMNNNNFNGYVVGDTAIDQGMIIGMGRPGNAYQSYCAFVAGDSGWTVKHNAIYHTGYIPIAIYGGNIKADSNDIYDFLNVKVDGAGVYSWVGSPDTVSQGEIKGNVIHNGGNNATVYNGTTATPGTLASAVYLDSHRSNTTVSYNSADSIGGPSYLDHGPNNNWWFNKSYGSPYADLLVAESVGVGVITGLSIKNNTFASGTLTVPAVRFTTINNDLPTMAAAMDSNQVAGSIGTVSPYWTFSTGAGDPGTFRTPAVWTSILGYDAHSTFQIGSLLFLYNATNANASYPLVPQYQDLSGTVHSNVTLPAYSSGVYYIAHPGVIIIIKVGKPLFN
jgi:hypothetical protein